MVRRWEAFGSQGWPTVATYVMGRTKTPPTLAHARCAVADAMSSEDKKNASACANNDEKALVMNVANPGSLPRGAPGESDNFECPYRFSLFWLHVSPHHCRSITIAALNITYLKCLKCLKCSLYTNWMINVS